jgi:hypothetical protein
MKTEMVGDLGLENLFELQDRAFAHNFQNSEWVQRASATLARSIRLNLSILGGMRFAAEKQTAIRLFAVDTLSHIVIAARIGLWGALPESLSVLRGGIESCVQLGYLVSEQLYKTAIVEINGKRLNRLEFASACAGLGSMGHSFAKHHAKISNLASHATSRRLRQSEYEIDGESYDRLGFATDSESAELATSECMEISQMETVYLTDAYTQDSLSIAEQWVSEMQDLHDAHEAFKNQLVAKRGDSAVSE